MLRNLQKDSIITKLISPLKLPFLLHFLFIFFTNHHSLLTQAHTFIYAVCSQEKYQPNSPYETNLNSILSSISSSSSQSLYNSFAIGNDSSSSSAPDAAAFGLYQCREDLKVRDCSTCISSLINQIELLCPYTYGATLQLDGCFIRYEHADFLGIVDTTLRYKKCSNSYNNDVEFLRRRDDVLADLQGAISFRVSVTGAVEGYAQCLGDLGGSDCTSCLSDAVMQVKSLCGTAAAGEVYLGQCYVRYWEAGYYDASNSDSSNQDEAGKTVAIIVGVIAGIAVVIVLLSVCKKSLSKH